MMGEAMSLIGTLLPRANAAACPQLANADFASGQIGTLSDYIDCGRARRARTRRLSRGSRRSCACPHLRIPANGMRGRGRA